MEILQRAIETSGKLKSLIRIKAPSFFQLFGYPLDELASKFSRDGKGRAIDNRWIERFWKKLKCNHIYLNPLENGIELFNAVEYYINYSNEEKKHYTIKEIPSNRDRRSLKNAA